MMTGSIDTLVLINESPGKAGMRYCLPLAVFGYQFWVLGLAPPVLTPQKQLLVHYRPPLLNAASSPLSAPLQKTAPKSIIGALLQNMAPTPVLATRLLGANRAFVRCARKLTS